MDQDTLTNIVGVTHNSDLEFRNSAIIPAIAFSVSSEPGRITADLSQTAHHRRPPGRLWYSAQKIPYNIREPLPD